MRFPSDCDGNFQEDSDSFRESESPILIIQNGPGMRGSAVPFLVCKEGENSMIGHNHIAVGAAGTF